VTDIFFSYSSADRERVRPIRDALVAQGFEVFWDQQVPPGMDWDTWIRQHLTKSKCAMAFWSATSVSSDNVRHEAMVAKQQGKLISVLLEPLTAEQFPMGLYAQQAANLSGWNGDHSHDEWRKFRREFEAKLTPLWVRRQLDELEAELVGERARREGAERRDRVLQNQIAKEAEAQQHLKQERDSAVDEVTALKATVEKLSETGAEATAREVEAERRDRALQAQIAKGAEAYQDLKRERDKVLDEVAALQTTVEELTQARAEAKAKQADAQQALTRERNKALDEVAALKTTIEELTQARAGAEARAVESSQRLRNVRQSKAQEIARSIGTALSPLIIAAAVATAGFWTYQLIWSGPETVSADTAATKEEEQRQAKIADLEAKLTSAEAEQQRLKEEVQLQAKASVDADGKRKTAEAEQGRLKEQVQLQTKGTADANAKLQAAQTEQQRLKNDADSKLKAAQDEVQRLTKAVADLEAKLKAAAPMGTTGLFTIRANTEATYTTGTDVIFVRVVPSIGDCEASCARSRTCKIFTYRRDDRRCYTYSNATLAPNYAFDSGIRE
jgi:hypothetical protein